jgi:3'(2'), 5'-bisphosphate nucleotidase
VTGDPIGAIAARLPDVLRWSGAVARRLRRHDIAVGGKQSGSADTDALTLTDLAVQELLVGALRDAGPEVRACRLEAEEAAGDLGRFAADAPFTIALDPIDGTREYRDRTGDGYAVMLHVRTADTVGYSLVYLPEDGPDGRWLEAHENNVRLGPDDPTRPARAVLDAMPALQASRRAASRRVLVSGFQAADRDRARAVSASGLLGMLGGERPGSLYPLMATGEIEGALFHTPNVYDFPVCVHLARLLGGDAVWVHDGRPIHFRDRWRDERASMLRLPGIVACAVDRAVIRTLVEVARDWSPIRYPA